MSEQIDWNEVDWLMENGYWPENSGYYAVEYIHGDTKFTFKTLDFILDYKWAQDYYVSNNGL